MLQRRTCPAPHKSWQQLQLRQRTMVQRIPQARTMLLAQQALTIQEGLRRPRQCGRCLPQRGARHLSWRALPRQLQPVLLLWQEPSCRQRSTQVLLWHLKLLLQSGQAQLRLPADAAAGSFSSFTDAAVTSAATAAATVALASSVAGAPLKRPGTAVLCMGSRQQR